MIFLNNWESLDSHEHDSPIVQAKSLKIESPKLYQTQILNKSNESTH